LKIHGSPADLGRMHAIQAKIYKYFSFRGTESNDTVAPHSILPLLLIGFNHPLPIIWYGTL